MKNMATIKLGFAPTRRSIFSAPDALKYAGLTKERLTELFEAAGCRRLHFDGVPGHLFVAAPLGKEG